MKGTISVETAAAWLGIDNQTCRLLIRSGVSWAVAQKARGKQYIYIIYRKKFEQETGLPPEYDPQKEGDSGQFCKILSDTIERFQALQTETDDSEVWRDCQRMIDSLDCELDAKRKGRFDHGEL